MSPFPAEILDTPLPPAPKKPRHRHSAVQLAALNGLFEETDHPSLSQRTALAHSLGLELKSVNAYFQNKRASSKKHPRGIPYDAARPLPSLYLPPTYTVLEEYHPLPHAPLPLMARSFRSLAPPLDQGRLNQLHPSTDQIQLWPHDEHDDLGLSPVRGNDLEHIYRSRPFPSFDDCAAIADNYRMPHQVVVEWFKRRARAQESYEYSQTPRHYVDSRPVTLPPISSLSASHTPMDIDQDSPIHDAPPSYSDLSALAARPRRGRPDPFQLHNLRRLLSKTLNPSIEERSALAREIGMDLGKVTNWYRNIRQSARKRAKRAEQQVSEDEFDVGENEKVYLSETSRSTPSRPSSAEAHSSDDEQEVFTPSSCHSHLHEDEKLNIDASSRFSFQDFQDAELLLSFHRQTFR
ncbi:unnamed protein product [Mycena citricolor]|uniref:Homeobox domain-containing protein n=1 Tax=Mycena citricolor TaxID=2018698 RepID=A0AAD2GYR2_9AGAR|nr:unnamed protein product [Mycena citricolor]